MNSILLLRFMVMYLVNSLLSEPQQSMKFHTFKKVCQQNQLADNNKLFVSNAINNVFIGRNDEDFNNLENIQLDYDLLVLKQKFHYFPLEYKIISTIYRSKDQNGEICSLILNNQNQTYFINCIENILDYYINNVFELNLEKQYQIQIEEYRNGECNELRYDNYYFYIICFDTHQYYLIQISAQITVIQNIIQLTLTNEQLTQCKLHYSVYLEVIYYALYDCKYWSIYEIIQKNETTLLIDFAQNEQMIHVEQKENYLQNVSFCQNVASLIFSTYVHFFDLVSQKIKNINFDIEFNRAFIIFQTDCSLEFFITESMSQKKTTIISNKSIQLHTDWYSDQICYFNNYKSILFKHNNQTTLLLTNLINSTINESFQEIIKISHLNYFIGIDYQNNIKLFKIQQIYNYYPYSNQPIQRYTVQYEFKDFKLQFKNCFVNVQDNTQSIKLNENYFFISEFYRDAPFTLSKDVFYSTVPFKASLAEGVNKQFGVTFTDEFDFHLTCNISQQFPDYQDYFYIFNSYQTEFLILSGNNHTMIIFNCQSKTITQFEINIQLSSHAIKYGKAIQFYVLDQSGYSIIKCQIDPSPQNKHKILQIYQLDQQVDRLIQWGQQSIAIKFINDPNFYCVFENTDSNQLQYLNLFPQFSTFQFQQSKNDIKNVFYFSQKLYFIQDSEKIIVVYQMNIHQGIFNDILVIYESGYILAAYQNENSHYNSINCFLVCLRQQEQILVKYAIMNTGNVLLSYFNIVEYELADTKFHLAKFTILVLSASTKTNHSLFLLVFDLKSNTQLQLLTIIQCGNFNFLLFQNKLFYYNINFKLRIFNCQFYTLIWAKQLDEIEDNFSIPLILEPIQNRNSNSDNQTKVSLQFYLISYSQEFRMKPSNSSSQFLLSKNGITKFDPGNYILGNVKMIILQNNTNFILKPPLNIQQIINCDYFCNGFCVFSFEDKHRYVDLSDPLNTSYSFSKSQIKNLQEIKYIKRTEFGFIVIITVSWQDYIMTIYLMKLIGLNLLNNYAQVQLSNAQNYVEFQMMQNILIFGNDQTKLYYFLSETIYQIITPFESSTRLISGITRNKFLSFARNEGFFQLTIQNIVEKIFVEEVNIRISFDILSKIIFQQFHQPSLYNFAEVVPLLCNVNQTLNSLLCDFVIVDYEISYLLKVELFPNHNYSISINKCIQDNIRFSQYSSMIVIQDFLIILRQLHYSIYKLDTKKIKIFSIYSQTIDEQIYKLNNTHLVNVRQAKIFSIQDWELNFLPQAKDDKPNGKYTVDLLVEGALTNLHLELVLSVENKNTFFLSSFLYLLIVFNLFLLGYYLRRKKLVKKQRMKLDSSEVILGGNMKNSNRSTN